MAGSAPIDCKEPGIFSETPFRRLFKDFVCIGWRRLTCEEPYDRRRGAKAVRAPDVPRSCEEAISESKAAELLGVSVWEPNRRMEEPPTFPTSRMETKSLASAGLGQHRSG